MHLQYLGSVRSPVLFCTSSDHNDSFVTLVNSGGQIVSHANSICGFSGSVEGFRGDHKESKKIREKGKRSTKSR